MTQQTTPRARTIRFPLVPLCAFGPSAFAATLFVAGFATRGRAVEPLFSGLVALLALTGLIGSITGQRLYRLRAIGALLNGLILAALAYAALGL